MSFGDHRARHRPYSVGQQPSIPPRRSRGQARPWPQSAVQPDRERIAGHRGADADAVLGCGSHRVHRYPPTRCVHLHQRGEALRAVPTQGDHRHRLRRGPCDPGSDRELTMSVDILHGEFGPGRVNAISDGLPDPRSVKRIPGDGAHANTLRTHRAPVPDMDPSTSSPRAWSCPAAQSLRVTLGRRPWERGRPARKRAAGPPHGQAREMPALPGRHSQGHALGGGVVGSGVSFLSALCGPSARCGQDARAPRTSLPGPRLGWGSGRLGRVVLVGASRAFGPLRAGRPRSQDVTPRATPWVGEWPARACRSCRRFAGLRPVAGKMPALPGRHSQGHALGRGVAGSGVSFLSALRGPSARCGQDARAPRTSLPGPRLGWGSGRLGRVVLVGASRAFGPLRARCPRSQDVTPRAVPWVGEWLARACRSCRRFAGLRPVAGKMPALPGHHSQGRALGGGVAGSGVSFLSALYGPSARCGQDARAPRTSLPGPCLSVLRCRLRAGFRARPRPGCSPSGKDVQCRVGRPRSARSSTCI